MAPSRAGPSACIHLPRRWWWARAWKSAAAAGLLLGLPAWAAIAAGNLAHSMVLPPGVRRVVVAADNDWSGTGQDAAAHAARRWRAHGIAVEVATPDKPGTDFNDVLAARLAMEADHG